MGLIDYKGLFKNENALTYEFLPKILPYRENEQQEIARAIKPVMDGRDGRNLLIYGPPGIGKTAATRAVLRELEEKSDIYPLYINCWKYNTSYKTVIELCHQAGYMLTSNKNTNELMEKLASILNKQGSVIVLDEADRLEDHELLYSLQEDLYKKSLIMITNHKEWYASLDQRLRSRIIPTEIEFKPYTRDEIKGILLQRIEYAFLPGTWDIEALELVVDKTHEARDVRIGLFLLREAGRIAEELFSKRVEKQHIERAMNRLPEFTATSEELGEDDKKILEIVRKHPGERIGKLYEIYKQEGGNISYKTFQRRIDRLAKGKYISIKKTHSGGTSTIIDTKISDYE
ncbi:AAA family ATPase [Candidatus Woesearchaeota archaeon]|nr:AAA family ATPase [Candidatus Woesearchaeota archaeon]